MTTRTFRSDWLDAHHIAVTGMSSRVVHREFGEHQEWGSTWTAVFEEGGKYWQVVYQVPNTSEVEADTWFDDNNVVATEVVPRGTFVTSWVPARQATGGTCAGVWGTCGQPAPFLVARRSGETGIETLERCERHLRLMFTSAEETEKIQEVKRRWH